MLANMETTLRFRGAAGGGSGAAGGASGTMLQTRPGTWAYPDMLEVGRLANATEDRSHFGLWAISSSPLVLGFDLTDDAVTQRVWGTITNTGVLAVNQAWVGDPGRRILATPAMQAWAKRVDASAWALFVLSNASTPVDASVALADVAPELNGTAPGAAVTARDLYARAEISGAVRDGRFAAKAIAPHDSVFVTLTLR